MKQRECSACGVLRVQADFSSRQWRKGKASGRCKSCSSRAPFVCLLCVKRFNSSKRYEAHTASKGHKQMNKIQGHDSAFPGRFKSMVCSGLGATVKSRQSRRKTPKQAQALHDLKTSTTPSVPDPDHAHGCVFADACGRH